MSDLRVTDIQKALRDHAMLTGHDVTQSHSDLHFRDNVFRAVVSRHLDFTNDLKSELTTHLMQSERPLLSRVRTRIDPEWNSTDVVPSVPYMFQKNNKLLTDKARFDSANEVVFLNHAPVNAKVFEDDDTLRSYGRNTFHRMNVPTTPKVDPIEALNNHKNARMLGPGLLVPHDLDRQPSRLLTPEEFHKFDVKNALNHLTSWGVEHPPFSELITVNHLSGSSGKPVLHTYGYDIDTEKMSKLAEKAFGE